MPTDNTIRKIRITSEGTGFGTHVIDEETGADISKWIQQISIDIEAQGVNRASLIMLIPRVDVAASVGNIVAKCPYCGHEEDWQPIATPEGAIP